MKARALHAKDLSLRCLALQRKGYWVAMCIDLDLSVQASTVTQARKLLKAQIASYVADAVGEDEQHVAYLLHRKAPWRFIAMYYAVKLFNATTSRLSYEAAMPMTPVGA